MAAAAAVHAAHQQAAGNQVPQQLHSSGAEPHTPTSAAFELNASSAAQNQEGHHLSQSPYSSQSQSQQQSFANANANAKLNGGQQNGATQAPHLTRGPSTPSSSAAQLQQQQNNRPASAASQMSGSQLSTGPNGPSSNHAGQSLILGLNVLGSAHLGLGASGPGSGE